MAVAKQITAKSEINFTGSPKKNYQKMNKTILNSKEAAQYLDISLDQLYKLSAAGKLPTHSPTGGKIYFFVSDLEEWVHSGRRATAKDIQKHAIKTII